MMTDLELEKLVADTIKWANDLIETWTGTTTGHVLQYQKNHLEQLVEDGEMNLASVAVLELAQTCDCVAEEDNEH